MRLLTKVHIQVHVSRKDLKWLCILNKIWRYQRKVVEERTKVSGEEFSSKKDDK